MKQTLNPSWEFTSDAVMGGISKGSIRREQIEGRMSARLTGRISLENNGGFIQMAFDVTTATTDTNLSHWRGVEIDVIGNAETYDMRLRTDQLSRPWQSYRAEFHSVEEWTAIQLPFSNFLPHRTDIPLDPRRIRRIGILAIGRVFDADIAVSEVRLFK